MINNMNNMISNLFNKASTPHHSVQPKKNCNYTLKFVETKGKLPFHSASISLKAYNPHNKSTFPIRIKWYRFFANRHYEITELENNEVFDFSSLDIGFVIKAVTKPINKEDWAKGINSISFGPVKFDQSIRNTLESVLLSGFFSFNVKLGGSGDELSVDGVQTIKVFLSQNQIKFLYYERQEEVSFYIELNSVWPKFSIPGNEIEKVSLFFDEVCFPNAGEGSKPKGKGVYQQNNTIVDGKLKIDLIFFTRNSRDIFVIACRLFRVVPVVSLSDVFRQVDSLVKENQLFESSSKGVLSDLLLEHDSMREVLMNTISYCKDGDKERDELQECIVILERDLETSLTEFKSLLNEELNNNSKANNRATRQNKKQRMAELNASLISNQKGYQDKLGGRANLSRSHVRNNRVQQNNQQFTHKDHEALLKELERVKKTKNLLLKELGDIKFKKKKKSRMIRNTLKEMSKGVSQLKYDMTSMNNTIVSRDAGMDSKLFNLQDLSMIKTSKEVNSPGERDKFEKILEETPFDDTFLEANRASNEIEKLNEEKNELLACVEDLQRQLKQVQQNCQAKLAAKDLEFKVETETVKAQKKILEGSIADLIKQMAETEMYVESVRKGMNSILQQEEGKEEDLNDSIMKGVYKLNTENKLKVLNLENNGMSKRMSSMKSEIKMLRAEVQTLRMEGVKDNAVQKNPDQKMVKEMETAVDELISENENLRQLLENLRKPGISDDLNKRVESLNNELVEMRESNQRLRDRGEIGGTSQLDPSTQKLIIDQLQKTNERLVNEISRLQSQVRQFEDARASFISESLNDSFISNSFVNSRRTNQFRFGGLN